ncbi:hypothetical protein HYY69_00165 [Candidatus Woesearchaeota archaeon]|nr:hypothetical protein [Candidatus Woesearchaeota archaeon]
MILLVSLPISLGYNIDQNTKIIDEEQFIKELNFRNFELIRKDLPQVK